MGTPLAQGTIVVLGAGQAGGWAAATLRKEGFTGSVVLVGDEPHRPYERPPLSKGMLTGTSTVTDAAIHPEDTFVGQGLQFRPNVRATGIDLAERVVHLDSGEDLRYDRLILTMGGRARPLGLPGADLPGVLTLRTAQDAQQIASRLRDGTPLVVIGGGWIGLEVAAAAVGHGCPVTVVEVGGRLCQRTVPPVISDYLLRLHTSQGVDVRLDATVSEIAVAEQADGAGLTVTLGDGTVLPTATVVVGVGLIPNDELAAEAGIACDRGVLVDGGCATSDPAVFAAGDVTVSPNPYAARPVRLESWQNAQEQGMTAARAALGHDVRHEILPWFWSDQYETRLQIYGIPAEDHQQIVRGDSDGEDFIVLFLAGDTVAAAMGPGRARELRLCKKLIEQQIRVDPATVADPDQPLPRK